MNLYMHVCANVYSERCACDDACNDTCSTRVSHHLTISDELNECFTVFHLHFLPPGLTICYPVPGFLKPWLWYSHLFMDNLWDIWNNVRSTLPMTWSTTPVVMHITALTIALVTSAVLAPRSLVDRSIVLRIVPVAFIRAPLKVAVIAGFGATFAGLSIALMSVPALLPPHVAWPIFTATELTTSIVVCHAVGILALSGQPNACVLMFCTVRTPLCTVRTPLCTQ